MDKTAKPPRASLRKKRWLWLLLPLLPLIVIEFFVDPIYNSIWLLRVMNTQYLVHARAELTVEGEPLVMERTFRCYKPLDYTFLQTIKGERFIFNDGQVGNTVHARTSTGRLFALVLPDVCEVMRWKRLGTDMIGAKPESEPMPEYSLRRNEINVPRVFEIHEGMPPKRIDVYIPEDKLLEGFRGIKIVDITLNASTVGKNLFLKDWQDLEWFGSFYAGRPYINSFHYYAPAVFRLRKDEWASFQQLMPDIVSTFQNNMEYKARLESYVREILSQTQDTIYYPIGDTYHMFSRVDYFPEIFMNLRKNAYHVPSAEGLAHKHWEQNAIIPCDITGIDMHLICKEEDAGVMHFQLWTAKFSRLRPRTFVIGNSSYTLDQTTAALLRASDQNVFHPIIDQNVLGRIN